MDGRGWGEKKKNEEKFIRTNLDRENKMIPFWLRIARSTQFCGAKHICQGRLSSNRSGTVWIPVEIYGV